MSVARIVMAIALGAALGAGAYAAGFDAIFAAGWGIAGSAVIAALGVRVPDTAQPWPPEVTAPVVRSSEVSRLAWSIRKDTGEVRFVLLRRFLAVVRRRLARLGIDVDADADAHRRDALLGDGVWNALTGPTPRRIDVDRALDALDAVDPPKEG